jgi:hypothetical protein
LANLRNNPHHLEFILGGYHKSDFLKKLHGSNYIRQCTDLILENRLHVAPYYVLDTNRLPNVVVTAIYNEDQQFLGDYGSTCNVAIKARCYAKFNASELSSDGLALKVAKSYGLEKILRPGMQLFNADFVTKIDMIVQKDTYTEIHSQTPILNKLSGWEAKSAPLQHYTTVNSSLNACTAMLKLKSSGDIESHKLLCMVLRYCLKFSRISLDNLGFQKTNVSQQMTVLEDADQAIFATTFQVSGVIADSWIVAESTSPEFIDLTMCAVPEDLTSDEIVRL